MAASGISRKRFMRALPLTALRRFDLHRMGPLTTHETPEEFARMAQRSAVKLEEVPGVLVDGGYEGAEAPG